MPKKDFSGKNKTKDTYTGDWVFKKNKHTKGPNDSAGAWMTQKQARELHEDQLAAKRRRESMAASPAAPGSSTPTVPGTPAAPTATVPVSPDLGPNQAATVPIPPSTSTVPPWWIGQAIQNPDENQAFANAANALMPLLSPEDSQNMASYLATNFKDVFGGYSGLRLPIPTQITNERQDYLNPQRAEKAIQVLDRMQSAAGGDAAKFGKGYDFLRNAINLMNKYNTPGQPMTREQYAQFQAAVQAMQAQAGKDIGAYANLAQLFNLPGFTAGPIVSNAPSGRLNV